MHNAAFDKVNKSSRSGNDNLHSSF
jgi:hypothetical protein